MCNAQPKWIGFAWWYQYAWEVFQLKLIELILSFQLLSPGFFLVFGTFFFSLHLRFFVQRLTIHWIVANRFFLFTYGPYSYSKRGIQMIGQNLLVNREPIDITWNWSILVSIQFNERDQFHLNGKEDRRRKKT